SDALTVTASPLGNCDPIVLEVTLNGTPGPLAYPVNYRIIDTGTGSEVDAGVVNTGGAAVHTFQTDAAGVASDNRQYVVEITTNDNCTASSDPVDVNESARVPVTLAADPCVEPVTITATGGTGWTWTGPGNITDPAAST